MISAQGQIIWPAATPTGPAAAELRRNVEESVRQVVDQNNQYHHASIRQVIDAKNKLTAFARMALPDVKARNAAEAAALETFIVELAKTLETLAAGY